MLRSAQHRGRLHGPRCSAGHRAPALAARADLPSQRESFSLGGRGPAARASRSATCCESMSAAVQRDDDEVADAHPLRAAACRSNEHGAARCRTSTCSSSLHSRGVRGGAPPAATARDAEPQDWQFILEREYGGEAAFRARDQRRQERASRRSTTRCSAFAAPPVTRARSEFPAGRVAARPARRGVVFFDPDWNELRTAEPAGLSSEGARLRREPAVARAAAAEDRSRALRRLGRARPHGAPADHRTSQCASARTTTTPTSAFATSDGYEVTSSGLSDGTLRILALTLLAYIAKRAALPRRRGAGEQHPPAGDRDDAPCSRSLALRQPGLGLDALARRARDAEAVGADHHAPRSRRRRRRRSSLARSIRASPSGRARSTSEACSRRGCSSERPPLPRRRQQHARGRGRAPRADQIHRDRWRARRSTSTPRRDIKVAAGQNDPGSTCAPTNCLRPSPLSTHSARWSSSTRSRTAARAPGDASESLREHLETQGWRRTTQPRLCRPSRGRRVALVGLAALGHGTRLAAWDVLRPSSRAGRPAGRRQGEARAPQGSRRMGAARHRGREVRDLRRSTSRVVVAGVGAALRGRRVSSRS